MAKIKLTKELAWAAGKDEANRNMEKNNRKIWNEEDYNIAVKTTNRLLEVLEGLQNVEVD